MDFIALVDRIREALTRIVTAEEQRKNLNLNGVINKEDEIKSPIIPWQVQRSSIFYFYWKKFYDYVVL